MPASMRALAEMNVAQTRALYQRSANAFEAVFESWEDCLDAAGQGAVALNRKIMDIAERNISTGFDLATRLARAKNPVEAIELQAAYWRKQFGELRMQAEEVRTLLKRVTDSVAEPIKAQVTLRQDASLDITCLKQQAAFLSIRASVAAPRFTKEPGPVSLPPQAFGPQPWSNRTASSRIATLATVASCAPSLT